mmetsp:Transcript_51357/g.103211  ORF Transcript_51357/g.103211 Transcript_51357/m.103211 type:complete len:302 (-) Transcript_51357:166-1071(-)|eukprot:CAMPEP_0113818228 /NCGR_PEP_ID=MMETSP0328-20130328/135_1 /TAXON_ID=39455 /ORGANISM="Alexandrium minutum" /LENGTH=301 /DNA_ID=CAMNT_0000786163 /DNA_START=73 /DNA_END=978 /DNA_ORIENTATION=- /assembly_acc=CAM_ASM_000350
MEDTGTSAPDFVTTATKFPSLRGSANRLYNAATIAKLTSHSWNVFRYIGDYLHLFGVVVLLVALARNRSLRGFSRGTQVLYFLVSITRYLDLFDHSQHAYLVFFKVTYIATSVIALGVFRALDGTYERQKDTCSLAVILMPCAAAAVLFTNELSLIEVLWSFSQFLEGFAMVPQYVFCYRDRGARDIGVSLYVMSLGSYRMFYAANWIYKKVQMPQYSDLHSWSGGAVNAALFCDFLVSRLTGCSLLRSMVLKVDEKINEIQDVVEMKVLGSSRSTRAPADGDCELRQRRKVDEAEEAIEV